MKEKERIQKEIYLNSKWKNSLKSLYKLGSVSITSGIGEEAVSYIFERGFGLDAELNYFIGSSKPDLMKFPYPDLSDKQSTIFLAQELVSRLIELKLVNKRESGSYTVVDGPRTRGEPICEYTLSEKGLDTVLKLIEHDDNNDRFNTQTEISKHLKRNSNISVGVSVLAFCVAVYGATLSFKRLTILENSLIDKAEIEQTLPVEKKTTQPKKSSTDTNQ